MTIPPPSSIVPEIDAGLDAILAKALAREPDERFSTAEEMRLSLEAWARKQEQRTDGADVGRYISSMFQGLRGKIQKRIEAQMASQHSSDRAMLSMTLTGTGSNPALPNLLSGISATGPRSGMLDVPPHIDISPGTGSSAVVPMPQPRNNRGLSLAVLIVGACAIVGFVVFGRGRTNSPPAAQTTLAAPPVIAVAATPAAPASAPPVQHAFVTVVSEPQGATVQWNGRAVGLTPATLELPAGAQPLSLSKEGFEPTSVTVDVPESSAQPLLRSVTLKVSAPRFSYAPPPPRPRAAPAAPAPAPEPPATATVEAPKRAKIVDDSANKPAIRVIEDPRSKVKVID